MSTAFRLVSLGVLFASMSLTALAQYGQLQGELKGVDGEGLEGIAVVLERQDTGGSNQYEIVTNDRGYFTHLSIAPGGYEISFKVGDKQYLTQSIIGTGQVAVQLDLSRMEYEGNEFSRISGKVERVVRDIRESREEAAKKATSVREAFDAGRAAMEAGNFDEAINQFSAAAEGDSSQHVIFGNLGVAYERAAMWPEALAAYEKAQNTADLQGVLPEEANYFSNLTLAYAMNGNVDNALDYAEKAAGVDPVGAGQSYYNIGAILTSQGDLAGATQAFERAIEVNPEMAEAYYQIALAKFGNESTIPEAIPLLEKYLELAPAGQNADGARGLLDFAQSQ